MMGFAGKILKFRSGFRQSAIPESKGLPVIGTLLSILAAGGAPKLHLYIDKRHREHGAVFREKLGPVPGVFVSDGNHMRKIFAAEGKYPKHIVPESWATYNAMYNYKRGLLFMDGEEWLTCRKQLNSVLLKNYDDDFTKAIATVAEKLIQKWRTEKEIIDLEHQLYKWSLEVVVAVLMGNDVYEQKGDEVVEEIDKLAYIVHQVFVHSADLSLIPVKLAVRLNLPVWRKFTEAVGLTAAAGRNMLSKIEEIELEYPEKLGLLGKIRESGVKYEDLSRIVTDLILAAGDTTSYTMQWILHLLSINPRMQETILEEVKDLGEKEALCSALLKGVLRETLRLYPVAPFITRYMPEDVFLDNYVIKAGELVLMSLYTSGRDEKSFPDPDSFNPRRWVRSRNGYENVVNPNSSLPFAMGARSCIGRKIAEAQIMITLLKIIKNFELRTNHEKAIDIKLHLISVPEKPINLILKTRI